MHQLPRVYLELELSLNEDLSGQDKVLNDHVALVKTRQLGRQLPNIWDLCVSLGKPFFISKSKHLNFQKTLEALHLSVRELLFSIKGKMTLFRPNMY